MCRLHLVSRPIRVATSTTYKHPSHPPPISAALIHQSRLVAHTSLHVLVLETLPPLTTTAKFPGLAVGSGDHNIRHRRYGYPIKSPTYSGRKGVGEDMGKGSPGFSHLTVPNRGTCDMYNAIQPTVKQIPRYIMILVWRLQCTFDLIHANLISVNEDDRKDERPPSLPECCFRRLAVVKIEG